MSDESWGMLYMPPADRVLSEKYSASLNVHSITTLPKTMPHTIQARSMHRSSSDALFTCRNRKVDSWALSHVSRGDDRQCTAIDHIEEQQLLLLVVFEPAELGCW